MLCSCTAVRYFPGGAGKPASDIVGVQARARNISFQYIGSELAEPAILSLPDGGLIACQLITPTEYRLQRLNDTLGTVWKTPIAVPEATVPHGIIFGLEGYAPRAEMPFRLDIVEGDVVMLSYRLMPDDTLLLLARRFDTATGAPREERVLHRSIALRKSLNRYNRFRFDITSDLSHFVAWTRSPLPDEHPEDTRRGLDLVMLGRTYSVEQARNVTFTPTGDDDYLQTISFPDTATALIASLRGTSLGITRLPFDGTKPTRLDVPLPVPDEELELMSGALSQPDKNVVRSVMAISHDGSLFGVASTRLDLSTNTVVQNRLFRIEDSVIGKALGEPETFDHAILRGSFLSDSLSTHVMMFEQMYARSYGCFCGDVLMLAFGNDGALRWQQGFHKDQGDGMGCAAGSFNFHVTKRQTVQCVYRNDETIVMREFNIADGGAADGGKERILLKITKHGVPKHATPIIGTVYWLNDNSFVMSILERENQVDGDMKLVKIDY